MFESLALFFNSTCTRLLTAPAAIKHPYLQLIFCVLKHWSTLFSSSTVDSGCVPLWPEATKRSHMDLTRFQTNHQQCAPYKLPFVWEMHVEAISLNHVDR